jgi:hypothetical protein
MTSKRVKQILPQLRKLQRMKTSEQKKYLKVCDKKLILTICECVKNLLKGCVPLSKLQLSCLSRKKKTLRLLSLKGTSLIKRKKILQTGGFLSTLLGPLISGLTGIVGGLFKKQ